MNVHVPDKWDTGAFAGNKRPLLQQCCGEPLIAIVADVGTGLIGRHVVDFVVADEHQLDYAAD